MTPTPNITLTYEERHALPIIRKLLKRRPEAAALVFEGMAKESAVNILLTAKKEMEALHTLSQAMVNAAKIIATIDKPQGELS
jgi:hypothetical protein